ncbi:myogenesis-regulating glycosidase-like [Oppia nitens]|uniref:myogenesis-regulating glycosidase-like n=1 Tax=Oppia nitens TaxID=1686743 RepID=UPI0023DAB829|nr:myogenesis-regulating glycosidase-like [Oppia nitens]
MDSSKGHRNNEDDLYSLSDGNTSCDNTIGSYRSSARTSISSYDFTPIETPGDWSPRLPRKAIAKNNQVLQLSEDTTTWKVVHKRSKRSPRKQQIQNSTAKMQAILMKGNAPEFRFRIVVGLILIAIVIIILSTRYFYNRNRILMAIRDRIFFIKEERHLNLLDSEGHDLLHIEFGLNIPPDIPPVNCKTIEKNMRLCFDWKYRAHLSLQHKHYDKAITCYDIKWKSYEKYAILKDCFDMSDSFWYGMGDVSGLKWPLNDMSLEDSPFMTSHSTDSDNPFGSLIGRHWFSSKGITISVGLNVPLFVSLNSSEDPNKLCFISKKQFPYYVLNKDDIYAHLEYTICTAPRLPDLQNHLIENFPKKETKDTIVESNSSVAEDPEEYTFLERHIWATDMNVMSNFTHQSVQSYVDRITSYGFEPGIILLDSRWENIIGNLKLNKTLFATPSVLINILHNKGFKIFLTITPNIDLRSDTLVNARLNHRLLRDNRLNVPLLTRCGNNNEFICGLINLTNADNREWFRNRLVDELITGLSIDGFLFVGGQSSLMPRHMNVDKSINPDYYLNYMKRLAINTTNLIGTTSSVDAKQFDGFVKILPRKSSWQSLRSLIPTVLSLSLMGYPLVNTGSVGGVRAPNETSYNKELYIRWLQVTTFFPVIQFGEPDSDPESLKITKRLLKQRDELILPAMKKCLKEFQRNGSPIIRPMWWTQPDDSFDAYIIDDQFSIGNDIIVAPVVDEGHTERDIFLPNGWWKDEISMQVIRGGKWMRKYQVPVDKVAVFIRTESSSTSV